jgi:hypothetical protein
MTCREVPIDEPSYGLPADLSSAQPPAEVLRRKNVLVHGTGAIPSCIQIHCKLFENRAVWVLTDSLPDAWPAKEVFEHDAFLSNTRVKKGVIMRS